MNTAETERLLRDHGCSLTPQRRAILAFLNGNLTHPTASDVFSAVTTDFPLASRATVYNTLTLLGTLGVVRSVRGADGEARFDPNTAPHHHRECPVCGTLEDVAAEAVQVRLRGDEVAATVRFVAPCPDCA